jgi:hypothetical protein
MFGLGYENELVKHVEIIYGGRKKREQVSVYTKGFISKDSPRVGNMAASLNPMPEQLTTTWTPGKDLTRKASFTSRSSIDMIFPPRIWNWRSRKEQ